MDVDMDVGSLERIWGLIEGSFRVDMIIGTTTSLFL